MLPRPPRKLSKKGGLFTCWASIPHHAQSPLAADALGSRFGAEVGS